jgi:hypothetical protein
MSAKSRYTKESKESKESSTDLPPIENTDTTSTSTTPRKRATSIIENTETTSITSTTSTTPRKRASIVQDEPSRRRRISLSGSPKRTSRMSQSQSSDREFPPEAFASDNEYDEGSQDLYSPMNIDDGTSTQQSQQMLQQSQQSQHSQQSQPLQQSQQSELQDDDETKVGRVVRHFINVFVQNPDLWKEFKEVVDSTSRPIAIPSIKGKEIARRTSMSQPYQVIYN